MRKIAYHAFLCLILAAALSSCATYRVRIDPAREWIEGKPFPVRAAFSKLDDIGGIALNYSFNAAGVKTVAMNRQGNVFTYTIPGEEVVQGTLRYTITYSYKGKLKTQDSGSIAVMSLKEAKEKYTRDLRSRVSFTPPAQAPVNRDRPLSLTVKAAKPSTAVTFHIKTPQQAAYRQTELTNAGGTFTAVVGRGELQAGYDTYYFRVTEDNPDLGKLEVFVGDPSNPLRYEILSIARLKELVTAEVLKGASHAVPQNVYATRDLQILLSVDYAPGTFAREFTKNAVSAELFYRSQTSDFKRIAMAGSGSEKGRPLACTIPSADLKAGYNSYYFKITDVFEDMGAVTVQYPPSGERFSYAILSVEEIRALKAKALRQRIAHEPVREADGVSELRLALKVDSPKPGTTATLYFRRSAAGRYKNVPMTNDGPVFESVISVEDQQSGYTQYYFVVSEPDEDVGTVAVQVPENGQSSPFQFAVLDKNAVKARLVTDLRARISHVPVTSAADSKDLQLSIEVKNMKSGTQAFFHHRRPGEGSYRQTRLPGNGPQFTMVVPRQDVRAGYSQYYFEVKEPHAYFGYIEAAMPSPSAPYEFQIAKLKDAVLNGVDFTPISDAEFRAPVAVRIKLNNNPEGARVFLKYRTADDAMDYLIAEMTRSGNEYSAVLSPAILQEGKRIDYYFSIAVEQEEFTYPDQRALPLAFKVKKQAGEEKGVHSVFGSTGRAESNVLEARVFQFEAGASALPQNMHKDYKSLITLYARKIDIPTRNFTEGFPGLENVLEWFGVQYRGSIVIRNAGLYSFRLLSDDGSKLFVDSNLVIDNDGLHAPRSKSGEIYLSPGTYPIRVDYFQGPKMQIALQLFAAKPGEAERLFDLKDFE